MPWSSAQRARCRQVASAVLAGRLSLVVVSRKASVRLPQESLWVTVMGPKGFFYFTSKVKVLMLLSAVSPKHA